MVDPAVLRPPTADLMGGIDIESEELLTPKQALAHPALRNPKKVPHDGHGHNQQK